MNAILSRALLVWVLIILAESVHGILRELLLKPLVGDFRARQIAVFTGMLIILSITYACIRWIRAETTKALLWVGLLWIVLTLAFEFSLGMLVLGLPWVRLLEDYDFRRGGLLTIGMIGLGLAPLIAKKLRATRAGAGAPQ